MALAKLDPADVHGLLIVSESDAEGKLLVAHIRSRCAEIKMDATIPALLKVPNPLPVGVVFSIYDREANPPNYKQWAT